MSVNEISNEINNLSYEDKKKIYTKCFSTGYINPGVLNDKLILISLISLSVNKLKVKNPTITTLDFLAKITNTQKDSSFYSFLEGFSIVVDDFAYEIVKFDSCGLTTSQDIINKIKELLNSWLPF